MTDDLKLKISSLPNKPGVYKFFNKQGELIYIGKAKSLKKRVSSYFSKQKYDSAKTAILVRKINDLEFLVVQTEYDALLLENNLIKQFKPKYNIQLKDDKTFPWLCIKNESFPRIFPTRNKVKDGSEYFGPYASVKSMKTMLDLISQLYPLRTCNYDLSMDNIEEGKYKVCLEYHIGKCKGPCVDYSLKDEYDKQIDDIREIIKGKTSQVLRRLKDLMKKASEELDFERAQLIKSKMDLLEHYQAKSTVVSSQLTNLEVFAILSDDKTAYVNYLFVVDGAIVNSHTLSIKKKLEEADEEVLTNVIHTLREKFQSESRLALVSVKPDVDFPNTEMHIPQRGDKKHLMDLALRNARYVMLDAKKRKATQLKESGSNRVLETIQTDFRLKELPRHIECFDNSNFQGTNAVAACAVFKDAKPAKKEYRHFNIKTVEGPDDFASMREVVYRRYKRMLEEGNSLPQLIVIDGGKGQLSSAYSALQELELDGKVAIVGIAKKLEEIFFPGDSIPVYIDKRSESLKVIQNLRNEAHRFGIKHHRNKRSKDALMSELTIIPGIGEKTLEALINEFGSVKRIRGAKDEELIKVIGIAKFKVLKEYFSNFGD